MEGKGGFSCSRKKVDFDPALSRRDREIPGLKPHSEIERFSLD
jgi:hypothetical protein